jgi:hypothetical protein
MASNFFNSDMELFVDHRTLHSPDRPGLTGAASPP